MATHEIKQKLSQVFPEATHIRVRQYPITYKGSMRGYTDISISGVNYKYTDAKELVREALGTLNKTFVDIRSW